MQTNIKRTSPQFIANKRVFKQNKEGKWFYKDTETLRGNTYINYYMSQSLKDNKETSCYSSISEELFNSQDWK